MLPIELRSNTDIKDLCYETVNDTLGLDGIKFNAELFEANTFTKFVGVYQYEEDTLPAIEVATEEGLSTYVHLAWLKKFNGGVCLDNLVKFDDLLVQVTRVYYLNQTDGTVQHKDDLPICGCGARATVEVSGISMCTDCRDKLTKLENYSYKPTPVFIGEQLKGDTDHPLHFGIEIEVSTKKPKLKDYMAKHKEAMYLKSDSSICGGGFNVEMVTHPHTFKELMEGDMIADLVNVPTNDHIGNGVHVHISRTTFADDKHYGLFYFLLHSMEGISTHIGGRALTSYCPMAPTGRVHAKDKEATIGNRQVYLNETNSATIEARFFQGTTDPDKIKGYVQYLESMIKYTKYHAKTVTSKGWFQYISKKSKKYKELLILLATFEGEYDAKVVYRQPKEKVITNWEKIPLGMLKCITKVAVSEEVEYTLTSAGDIYVEEKGLIINYNHGRSRRVYFNEIESITIEKV